MGRITTGIIIGIMAIIAVLLVTDVGGLLHRDTKPEPAKFNVIKHKTDTPSIPHIWTIKNHQTGQCWIMTAEGSIAPADRRACDTE